MRAAVFLAFLLAACATVTAPRSPPVAPLTFDAEPPLSAQILAVHGFNDHKQAFAGFGAHAAAHSVRLEAYDQQGFGENENWSFWPGRDLLVADLAQRIRAAHLERPDLPLFVLGESMGAAVAIVTIAQDPSLPVDGVILVAPAVWAGDAMSPIYRGVLWAAARLFPGWRLTGEGLGKQASDNIEMLRALQADELFIKATRIDAIEGLVHLMEDARERGPELELPRLLLAGAKDEIVPPDSHQSFVDELPAQDCMNVVYDDGWHMLLRDDQRRKVWNDILSWIEAGSVVAHGPCGQP